MAPYMEALWKQLSEIRRVDSTNSLDLETAAFTPKVAVR